MQLNLQSWRPR